MVAARPAPNAQIKLLGERGADPNLRNDADRTPLLSLEYAVPCGPALSCVVVTTSCSLPGARAARGRVGGSSPNYVLQEGTLEHVVARALVVAGTDLGISFRVGTAISQSTRERDQIREMVNLLKERYERAWRHARPTGLACCGALTRGPCSW